MHHAASSLRRHLALLGLAVAATAQHSPADPPIAAALLPVASALADVQQAIAEVGPVPPGRPANPSLDVALPCLPAAVRLVLDEPIDVQVTAIAPDGEPAQWTLLGLSAGTLAFGLSWGGVLEAAVAPAGGSNVGLELTTVRVGGDAFVRVQQLAGPPSVQRPDGRLVRDVTGKGAWGFRLDLDCDGTVTFADAVIVIDAYGPCAGCREDLDDSGVVDDLDLLQVLGALGLP